ncbi:MAG: hypothetical protein U0Q12_16815 [Vicinamibacterales bacterium]
MRPSPYGGRRRAPDVDDRGNLAEPSAGRRMDSSEADGLEGIGNE